VINSLSDYKANKKKKNFSNRIENEWNILSEKSSLKIINSFTLRKLLQKIHYLNFKENWIATFEIIVQVQGRVANPRPIASRKQSQTHSTRMVLIVATGLGW